MKLFTFICRYIFLFGSLVMFCLLTTQCSGTGDGNGEKTRRVTLQDGAYYINGQKTFINALGYEIGARPGQHPYKDVRKPEIARMRNDLNIIKAAGFNAIRTWSELSEQQVQLVQESGLMLVYGIWILPDGNFADSQFVAQAEAQVRNVMQWSKNYDCIITYLIMNEPMAAHINKTGAQNTADLWRKLVEIIHKNHPGIPVTISNNSAIGEYLNERIFDVYGYNTYDYNEGLPGFTQGFPNHFPYLKKLNGENKPLLVTEFGLSVSPLRWGGMYGGNTRKEQAAHLLKNYRELLDAGVAGVCPFYYADGWWKANKPEVHDPYPEEWFGFWGYADSSDTLGHPRPVWFELKRYNQALIAEPRNQQIYGTRVPLEFYLQPDIVRVQVIADDRVILNEAISGRYFTGQLTFSETKMTDRELIFEFYDKQGTLLKWESIVILTSAEKPILPKIELKMNAADLSKVKRLITTFSLKNKGKFQLDKQFNYLFAHHIGWNPGDHYSKIIDPKKNEFSFRIPYAIPRECLLLNVAAGIDIHFGKFVKRIYQQKLIYRGDWANAIRVPNDGLAR